MNQFNSRFFFVSFSGSHSITTRGCAQQDYSYQTYRANESSWHTVTAIEESIYQEGCLQVADGAKLRRHVTQYCFCSGHLCNEAARTGQLTSALMSIPVVLTVKKFIQENL